MKLIAIDPPKEGKFIAFFGDGSGAGLFMCVDGGIIDHEGDDIDDDYLLNAGYCQWMPLPDDFKLWFETTI